FGTGAHRPNLFLDGVREEWTIRRGKELADQSGDLCILRSPDLTLLTLDPLLIRAPHRRKERAKGLILHNRLYATRQVTKHANAPTSNAGDSDRADPRLEGIGTSPFARNPHMFAV